MSTTITIEDGSILGLSNGGFDWIMELAAAALGPEHAAMSAWLLDQRCDVRGPGVGYLDLQELSPSVCAAFRAACKLAAEDADPRIAPFLEQLLAMWRAADAGEPAEKHTSPNHGMRPTGETEGLIDADR